MRISDWSSDVCSSDLFVGYAREQLGYETPITYELLNRRVSGKWHWGGSGRRSASAAGDLRSLLALHPRLRLLVAHGRSDLVTPYGISRYLDRKSTRLNSSH